MLDDLRIEHGRLDAPVPVGTRGGTLHVELNHTDPAVLPAGFRTDTNDARILACALNLAAEGARPGHGRAGHQGHAAAGQGRRGRPGRRRVPRAGRRARPAGPGWPSSTSPSDEVDALFDDGVIDLDAARELPCHTGLRLLGGGSARAGPGDGRTSGCGWSAATARRSGCAAARPSSGSRWTCCSTRVVGIVSLGGRAGTGKSALALCAGLEAVLERRTHRKVVVFRPLYAVGGQELGYLPGSESEKMAPWAQAVFDTLGALVSQDGARGGARRAACSRCCR